MPAPIWAWAVFGGCLVVLLGVDLWGHARYRQSSRAAVAWSIVWVAVGLAFAIFTGVAINSEAAHEYLAAYLIEESLSLDNLFLFLVIFNALHIPERNHHRALFWGIFGALALRGAFITAGVEALERWQWLEYFFAGLLFYAAYHAWREDPRAETRSRAVAWLSAHLPVSRDSDTSRFVVQKGMRCLATPLLVAILAIEATDVVFAADSVPAALSVSRQGFVVYSSNAFAILGLRALYVVLAESLRRLAFLNYGLAVVLGFAACKLALSPWVTVPPLVSVGVIVAILGATIGWSLRAKGTAGDKQIESRRDSEAQA